MAVRTQQMNATLKQYLDRALLCIDGVPEERKRVLEEVAGFISSKRRRGETAKLTFICTHNSRRSQMGQLWAAAAAAHCGIDGIHTYSGGTEATVFNPRAVTAMEKAGFTIEKPGGENPRYLVSFDERGPAMECFRYDDPKVADGTPQEAAVYDERCLQIATEMLYLFSRVA